MKIQNHKTHMQWNALAQTQRTRRPLGAPSDPSARWQLWKDSEAWHCGGAGISPRAHTNCTALVKSRPEPKTPRPTCQKVSMPRRQPQFHGPPPRCETKTRCRHLGARGSQAHTPTLHEGHACMCPPPNNITRRHGHGNLTGLEVYPIFGVPTEAADANLKRTALQAGEGFSCAVTCSSETRKWKKYGT